MVNYVINANEKVLYWYLVNILNYHFVHNDYKHIEIIHTICFILKPTNFSKNKLIILTDFTVKIYKINNISLVGFNYLHTVYIFEMNCIKPYNNITYKL